MRAFGPVDIMRAPTRWVSVPGIAIYSSTAIAHFFLASFLFLKKSTYFLLVSFGTKGRRALKSAEACVYR